jgi:peptidoglycan/xylan/chitin deacetylase (PgdA/CDA1 family)
VARIALKIDVDTWRGTRDGVPPLAALLRREGCGASFLFSLGPDHTGRAIRRAFRPGFFNKVSRTSVVEHYGIRTLMYGTLLPGPDIGLREADTLRAVRDAGFEVGVHTWDHVRWQDHVVIKDERWTREEMQLAVARFEQVFGERPRVHGAAGWQMNEAAYRIEAELGLTIASDTRGESPFLPVDARGEVLGPAQWPTTLPTLDELIGLNGLDVENVHSHLLSLTSDGRRDHVYTLHAELEGMKLMPVFERLIAGWKAQGHELVSLGTLHASLPASVPHCYACLGEVAGRSGLLAVQGPPVALDAVPALAN